MRGHRTASRSSRAGDVSPADDGLELAFEVRPTEIRTWLTVRRPTGETETGRGRGVDLPYDDASFARVACRRGLQLLPDRSRALEEMRRVLVRHGEIEVAVRGSIQRSPPFAELADSLERHAGVRSAAAVRWLFCMPEPEDLRGVLAAAAFDEIRVDVVRTTDRSPSIERSSPLGIGAGDRAGEGEEKGARRRRASIGVVDGSRRPAGHDGNDRRTCETTVTASLLDGLEPSSVGGQLGHVAGERDHEAGTAVLPVFHVCGAAVELGELLDQ